MGVQARGLQGQLARMVEGGGTGFHADARECDAGGAAWRNEGGGQQLRLHVLVQLGKHPSLSLSLRPALSDAKSLKMTREQLDYTCGVMPITHVNNVLDKLPATFQFNHLNGVAKGAYGHYDAEKMHGLPVAVQVVGQRLQEEKVLAVMERIEEALVQTGGKYDLLEIE